LATAFYLRRTLLALIALLLPCLASAEVVAGRTTVLVHDRWTSLTGGELRPLGFPAASAAFDGNRFLIGWNDGHSAVRLGLLDEGTDIPWTIQLIDGVGDGQPIIRWDGTRYVVVIDSDPIRLLFVSRQNVVEVTTTIPGATSIADLAASPAGITLVSHHILNTTGLVVEVLRVDRNGVLWRTIAGSVQPRVSGVAVASHAPRIVPFGEGFYVAWRETEAGRVDRLVGTRVTLDGRALDTKTDGPWTTATFIDDEPPAPYDWFLHPIGERLAVQTVRGDGSGLINTFIEPDGTTTRKNYPFSTLGLTNVATVRLIDGTIAAVAVRNGVAKVTALISELEPPGRRRSARH